MSLGYGRRLMSIPGPSVIPERVLNAMHRPSPNIYAGELVDLTATLYPDLKTVAQTKGQVAIYIANGHGAWEAAMTNTFSRGDKVLVLATGRFAIGWGEWGQKIGIEPTVIDFGPSSPANPAKLQEALQNDTAHKYKAILVAQTDTASSVQNDIPALRAAIDASGHPALFYVDCIASLGCEKFMMDDWGVDLMVAGCQKGLMTPPGLSFVYANDRALEARKTADLVTSYWDFIPRMNADVFYQKFGGTAPTHHLYGLREALDILVHEEGVENAWARHARLAKAIWAAVDNWGSDGGDIKANVPDQKDRSCAVTCIKTTNGNATRIREWCEKTAGVTLGIGLGMAEHGSLEWHDYFRIGHMGHLNIPMVMGTLGSIDSALKALDIPHGTGALEAASSVISQS
ncbi:aminotransferase class V-fold PLP-dependent enzyme [Amylibacter sp. SFDW26]|uniref:pyridoxal-phosphate-dependent aminotransferase family protein n=1 Tax=Amylibacter sp. SFDW26 TaxID=2652722 RepID=UPI0012620853|nr:aminotransferase class V-fold PLP-dependent enzyme [Amylibacter sp. SFDW26]KAB7616183.1 aminotransferase class V-fold PLP-dependent enzyme [Amylibacter sp. SFDW26]